MEWNSDYVGDYRIAYQGDLSDLVETLKRVWSEEDPLNGIYRGAREAEGQPHPFRFKGGNYTLTKTEKGYELKKVKYN